jgi:putative membrane-bound dehydrogenase-like protein
MPRRTLLACSLALLLAVPAAAEAPKTLKLLFLGDNGHHRPADRFRQLQPVMAARGIDLTYTDKVEALNPKTLAGYDGLIIYANTTRISPEQEKALLDYVAGGKGFIPLHCASYCFLNSPKYVELVGAQFKEHKTGTFGTILAEPDHPVMKGFKGFESWDETYVHTKHNEKDRTVLEYRKEGDGKEPWTWVRTEGKGRVFYTAWGHDERTWGNAGFQNLVERGIRWAAGGDPAVAGPFPNKVEMTKVAKDVKPFEYKEANVPFYPPGGRGAGRELKQMQLPLDPAESMKHIVHPDNLELRPFATEEQLGGGKPISMNWDERGRLWVAVTMDYPNEMQPEGKGRDRIIILEDTKGTGRADKVTIFADKLSIPTSLVFGFGGVIVHQAPHTLFLKDTDGDDKADVRQVLFSGWGTGDTHAGPSNLRYGPDNWYYGIVGYSGFSGTVAGERFRFSQGFYRFKVEADGKDGVKVTKMEFLRNTTNNSWGVGFSEEGLLFGSTANGCPSVYVPIPNRYYESVRGWSSTVLQSIAASNRFQPITDKIRQVDYHGGFTAGAGHALYTARNYPRDYWNRTAFVSDPTGHLTATLQLQPKGSDFQATYGWNLVASDDEWCSPVMAEVGPDGNVWVIDWYAYIVQHNPTPPGFKTGRGGAYETELRDKKHGRIYRLVATSAKPSAVTTLKDATPEKLVEALKSDNMFWRLHAQRLLIERGKTDVSNALIKLIEDPSVDAIGLNTAAIHALRTVAALGSSDTRQYYAVKALNHKSAGVRRNALAVIRPSAGAVNAIYESGVLDDADPQVRLAALLALSEMPANDRAGNAILDVLSRPENLDDRWIPHAAVSAAAAHDVSFLKAVAAAKTAPAPRALTAVGIVAEHYGRGAPADTAASVVAALADAPAPVAETVITGMAKGWPRGKTAQLTDDTEKGMARLLARLSPGGKGSLIKLATAWGSKGFDKFAAETTASLLAVVADGKASDTARADAAHQLAEFRPNDEQVVEKVLALITPRTSPELTAGLLDALSASQAANLGPAVVKQLGSLPPSARAVAVRVLLARPESTRVLLDAFDKNQVQLGELSLDQKQALAAHPDRQIAARAKALLARGGGLPSADRQKVIDQLLALTKKSGDAAAGKGVFTKHCATCHMHSGEGNKVGPDLTGMAVHPKEHLLVDIMDPSRSVEGNYRVYTVETKDGRVFSGLLASETKTSVELIDTQAKRIVLQRDNIDELKASPKSLMPEGFEKQMTEAELSNLLEFLTQRGKYLPLPMEKAATVVSTKGMFYSEDATGERLVFADWKPKTFDGVPFVLIDPLGDKVPNVIMLNSSNGKIPPKMPKSVKLPCNSAAKAIHFLSGVSGWGFPYSEKGTVSMIVRLHYEDGKTEDHELKNGEHFADYISRRDVPGSKFAFALRGQQIRYLAVTPKREEKIKEIELVKGPDVTAPVVMAVTVETR